MLTHHRWRCVDCRYQVSLTAGTVLHNTKLPLTGLVLGGLPDDDRHAGESRRCCSSGSWGLRRYETAWMLLHKLRRAMVNLAREPLHGEIEIDDTWVGGPQPGLRGSRQLKGRKAAIVVVAVEKRGRGSGRIRMAVVPNFRQTTMNQVRQAPRHAGVDGLHRRAERLRGVAGRRRDARGPDSTAPGRLAKRRPVRGATRGPGHRESAAVVDRHLPRR